MSKIAFVFSGQGAQAPGMGKELYDCSPAAKAVFDLADSIRPGTSQQCFEGTQEELNVTINTQPCLFACDLAAAKAAQERGIQPDCAAGFSLGEAAAVAFSGMLTEAEAFSMVCKRAELMNEAAQKNPGAMAAVMKLSPQQVETLCGPIENAWPVNYNSPKQTVVAASADTIDQVVEAASAQRGRAVKLAVSGGGRLADKHREHTGGHRIQCARVSQLACAQCAAQLGQHIKAGPACGLIDGQNAVWRFA